MMLKKTFFYALIFSWGLGCLLSVSAQCNRSPLELWIDAESISGSGTTPGDPAPDFGSLLSTSFEGDQPIVVYFMGDAVHNLPTITYSPSFPFTLRCGVSFIGLEANSTINANYGLLLQFGYGPILVSNLTFQECSSSSPGGAIRYIGKPRDSLRLENVTFQGCSSDQEGGAIFLNTSYPIVVQLRKTKFHNCSATFGGGGYLSVPSGTINLDTIQMVGCSATAPASRGGGLYLFNDAGLQIEAGYIKAKYNHAFDGAVIFITGNTSLFLQKADFSCNTAENTGAAIYAAQGNNTIEGGWVYANVNYAAGGMDLHSDSGLFETDVNTSVSCGVEGCCPVSSFTATTATTTPTATTPTTTTPTATTVTTTATSQPTTAATTQSTTDTTTTSEPTTITTTQSASTLPTTSTGQLTIPSQPPTTATTSTPTASPNTGSTTVSFPTTPASTSVRTATFSTTTTSTTTSTTTKGSIFEEVCSDVNCTILVFPDLVPSPSNSTLIVGNNNTLTVDTTSNSSHFVYNFSWGSIYEADPALPDPVKGIDLSLLKWARYTFANDSHVFVSFQAMAAYGEWAMHPIYVYFEASFTRIATDNATHSLKTSLIIEGDWQFNKPTNKLHVEMVLSGEFVKNQCGRSSRIRNSTAESVLYELYAPNNTITFLELLKYCSIDGVKMPQSVDLATPRLLDHGIIVDVVFPSFKKRLDYDPNLAVLLSAGRSDSCNSSLMVWILPASFLIGAGLVILSVMILGTTPWLAPYILGNEGRRVHKLRSFIKENNDEISKENERPLPERPSSLDQW